MPSAPGGRRSCGRRARRAATGSEAEFVYVDGECLRERGVGFWVELPLWIHESIGPSMVVNDSAAADTWTWMSDAGWSAPDGIGIAPDKERELIAAYRARRGN